MPSLCAARRIGSKGDWACAPIGACEGKMPSPPGPVAACQGRAGARREGRMPSLRGPVLRQRGALAGAMRRKAHRFDRGFGMRACRRVRGQDALALRDRRRLPRARWRAQGRQNAFPPRARASATGALAGAMRRKAHWFEGELGMRACRRVRGQDALAPKGPSPLQGRAGARREGRMPSLRGPVPSTTGAQGPNTRPATRATVSGLDSGWGLGGRLLRSRRGGGGSCRSGRRRRR